MKLSKFSGPASDSPPFLHDKSYAAADKLRVPNVFFLSLFSFFFLHPSVEISKIRKGDRRFREWTTGIRRGEVENRREKFGGACIIVWSTVVEDSVPLK